MQLKGPRVAAYARYSSDKQNERSIEDQLRRLRSYAAACGQQLDESLIFADCAVSGASTDRPQFETLTSKVRRREIDALLVEDVSRLSRDNADALNIYKECAYYGVQLVALADGIDSTAKGARLAYGAKALISDLYLEDLRDKTLRGLEGRAHTGHSTGGLAYGYRSTPVGDAKRPQGYQIEVDAEQAKVVVEVFERYAGGWSTDRIAADLNRRAVPNPRAGRGYRFNRGWSGGTIRAWLHNERYAGRWTFNSRRWVKVPGTNKRRPQLKPETERIVSVRENLRIVPQSLWESVQQRCAAVSATYTRTADGQPKGRALSGRTDSHPLSGLLFCALCGGPMTVTGGTSASYYKCAAHKKGRRCSNAHCLREDIAIRRLMGAIREHLARPEGIAYARKRITEKLGALARGQDTSVREARERLARTETRIAKLIDFIIATGESTPSVVEALKKLEAQKQADQRSIAHLECAADEPIQLPTPEDVVARVFDLERAVKNSPVSAREALRALFKGGRVSLEWSGDSYVARSELLPLVLMAEAKTGNPISGIPRCSAVVAGGCNDLRTTLISLPFEVRLVA